MEKFIDKEGYAGNWAPFGICPIYLDRPNECTCDKEMRAEFEEILNKSNP